MRQFNLRHLFNFTNFKQTSVLLTLFIFTIFAGFTFSISYQGDISKNACAHQIKASKTKPYSKSFTLVRLYIKPPINSIKKLNHGIANSHTLNEIIFHFLNPIISSKDFSIDQCSYSFLRLNVLKSQAHPPTLS